MTSNSWFHSSLKRFIVSAPDVWREILHEPMVVLGKVYVARNPEFDHVLFLVEVDDAYGADGHDGQGGHDHLPWTHADEDPEAAKNQKYFQSLD